MQSTLALHGRGSLFHAERKRLIDVVYSHLALSIPFWYLGFTPRSHNVYYTCSASNLVSLAAVLELVQTQPVKVTQTAGQCIQCWSSAADMASSCDALSMSCYNVRRYSSILSSAMEPSLPPPPPPPPPPPRGGCDCGVEVRKTSNRVSGSMLYVSAALRRCLQGCNTVLSRNDFQCSRF